MRQIAWRSSVPYRGYLLHDEVRVGADGSVHSVQWLAWPAATAGTALTERLDARALSARYFTTIERLLPVLLRARRAGAEVRLNVLGIPLLKLADEHLVSDRHTVGVGYTIAGGLLDATPPEKGRLCMKVCKWNAHEWRLVVEVARYRPLAVALVHSSLLYRLTQAMVHRWVSFHYLRYWVDHAQQLSETRDSR
jgi:hypothetical protein